ncbi:unnamed protein product [Haemonchus placei]|uniref:Uncharacterized protein n=1 Tax=Haemonchus placei TaxID=6290 RepID=A0A3P7U8Y6_HAEPC|nr:unnamed protein product [Haemonchus placei]
MTEGLTDPSLAGELVAQLSFTDRFGLGELRLSIEDIGEFIFVDRGSFFFGIPSISSHIPAVHLSSIPPEALFSSSLFGSSFRLNLSCNEASSRSSGCFSSSLSFRSRSASLL